MRTRILKPEEWGRLDGRDLGALLPFVEPQNIAVIVVEDAGEIVAISWRHSGNPLRGTVDQTGTSWEPGHLPGLIRHAYRRPARSRRTMGVRRRRE